MPTFRQALLPALDRVDQIMGPQPGLDLRPSQIVINEATWSGGFRGAGDPIIVTSPLPSWTKVRHVTTREVAESGGRYESGDIIVGPIRPSLTRQDGTTGGFSESMLDLQGIQNGIDWYFTVTQTDPTGTGINGDYELREFRRDRALRFMLVCKRKRTTPGGLWLPTTPGGLQLWWQDDSLAVGATAWADKSPNANNGSPSGSLTYTASDPNFNGLASLTGGGGKMSSPSFNLPCPYDIVIVANGNTGSQYFWTRIDTNDFLFGTNTSGNTYECIRGASETSLNLSANWGAFGTTPKTIELASTGVTASTKLYLNGTAQTLTTGSGDTGGSGTAASNAPFVLMDHAGVFSCAFVAIYNHILVSSDRVQMNNYLRNRYAHY